MQKTKIFLKSTIYQKFNVKNIKFQYTISITARFKRNIKHFCLKWKVYLETKEQFMVIPTYC